MSDDMETVYHVLLGEVDRIRSANMKDADPGTPQQRFPCFHPAGQSLILPASGALGHSRSPFRGLLGGGIAKNKTSHGAEGV